LYLQRHIYKIICTIFCLFLANKIGFPQDFQEIVTKDITERTSINQNDFFSQLDFAFINEKYLIDLFSSTDSIPECFIAIDYYWWMIIAGEKSSEMKKKLIYQMEVTKQEFTDAKNDLALVFVLSYELRVNLYYNKIFSAILSLNKINRRLYSYQKVQGSFNNEYFLLLKSLVGYMIAYINDKYPFYYTLLIHQMCIDKKYSIYQLKRLTRSKNIIVSTESNYFLMKIFFDNEHDFQSAEKYARTLAIYYPGNFIFSYYYVRILIENQNIYQAQVEKKRTLEYATNNCKLSETQKKYCKSLFQCLLKD